MDKRKSVMVLVGSIPASMFFTSFYSNQKIASLLNYQPALFWSIGPTGIGNSRMYWPFAWMGWYWKFGQQKGVGWIFQEYGIEPLYTGILIGFMIAAIIVARLRDKKLDIHGSAHFATKKEIYEFGHFPDKRPVWEVLCDSAIAFRNLFGNLFTGKSKKAFSEFFKVFSRKANDNNLLGGNGVFLGYLDDGTYLRDNAKTHTLLIAPTRSGKGVGHIIPTLLTWTGSTVVTDVKGENWDLTSGYRKSQLGNDVFMFKPTSKDSCKYNPLGEIRIGTHYEMGDLQLVTKILVDPTGKGSEGENAHWVDNAWQLLQGVTLHLLYQKKYHNYKIDENGNKVPLPGRTANLSDVLDFLYDEQFGAEENLQKKHEEFLAGQAKNQTQHNFEAMNSGIAGLDLASINQEQLSSQPVLPVSECAGEIDEVEAVKDPGLKYGDGSDFKDPAKEEKGEAGLKGFQLKLKTLISNYQLKYRPGENGKLEDYVAPFCHAPNEDMQLFERLYPDKLSRDGLHPHVRQIFQAMIDKPDKEFGSILSTLDTTLIIYRNPVLVHNISESDLVMKDLMDCKKPISLYLVFGPGEIDVVRPLCRVIVEMMWRLNVEEMRFEKGKMIEHKHRLLMLLDEFPALGKMGGIEQSEGFLAGYGIKLMIIAQDINQINSLYGKDNYVISNCQVQIYHGPSDNNSAKYLSDKLGTKTELQTSFNRSAGLSGMFGANSSTDSYTSRPLMYADEISRLSDNKLLIFCKGLAPVLCNKVRHYEDMIFAPRVKIKHPEKSDVIDNEKRQWDVSEYVLLKHDDALVEDTCQKFQEVDVLAPEQFAAWTGPDMEHEEVSVQEVEEWIRKG